MQPVLQGSGSGHSCQCPSIAPSQLHRPPLFRNPWLFPNRCLLTPRANLVPATLPPPPPPPPPDSQGQELVGRRGPLYGSASVSWGCGDTEPYTGQLQRQERMGLQSRGSKPKSRRWQRWFLPRPLSLAKRRPSPLCLYIIFPPHPRVGLRLHLPSYKDTSHAGLEVTYASTASSSDICNDPIFKQGYIPRSLGL